MCGGYSISSYYDSSVSAEGVLCELFATADLGTDPAIMGSEFVADPMAGITSTSTIEDLGDPLSDPMNVGSKISASIADGRAAMRCTISQFKILFFVLLCIFLL